MESKITNTFEKIYQEESDIIFRFCLTRVSNREQALDITQETFLRLWQSFQQGKKVSNNRAFLFTVAQRLVIDWYRKKKSISLEGMLSSEEGEIDLPDENTTEDQSLGGEGRYLLSKIEELTPVHRDPIYLRFVEDLSPPEIGKILGISTNAASVRINRGIKELREKTGYNI
jgi:RNA polymerase sigma-70 factor (ECF subfamily)